MIVGVAQILISCCLFIHLGLGEAIERVTHIHCFLFRCVKCMTFWSVLSYSISMDTNPITSITIAFLSAYLSLWVDLLLNKIAQWYEKQW